MTRPGRDGSVLVEMSAPTEIRRWLAVGDPQTSQARFFALLDRHGARADDVGLLSIGDHFDYGADRAAAARDGLANLEWLMRRPSVLIAGNHDLCRVIELAYETDESFDEARALAASGDVSTFTERFPRIPTPLIALRDFNGFTVAQRSVVQTLLLERRFALAAVGTVRGYRALFVHAGLSMRELAILGIPQEREPDRIARALNAWLDGRVERVADAWRRGECAALDLEPLHFGGARGVEGAGFLYQRPVNGEVVEAGGDRPRRFDARQLPRGLVQVVGHTAHKKSRDELGAWVTPNARNIEYGGGLRTLIVDDHPTYDLGLHDPRPNAATMIMIDAGMSDDRVADYPLLEVTDVVVPR
jgi:hypothetical protein